MPSQAQPDTARKVVAAYFLSLDGVAEAPDQFLTTWDDETDASGERLIATQDAVVLGRRTYDEWAGFWPGSEIQPFADFINAVPKYVATSSPLDGGWAGSHVIDGDLVDVVRQLKSQPGGDIGIHGSISVTQALLAAGVVDELRFVGRADHRRERATPARRVASHPARDDPRRPLGSGNLLVDYRVAAS